MQAAKPTPSPRHRLRASRPSAASAASAFDRSTPFDASDDASAAPSLANPASAWGVSDACEAPPQLDDELSSA